MADGVLRRDRPALRGFRAAGFGAFGRGRICFGQFHSGAPFWWLGQAARAAARTGSKSSPSRHGPTSEEDGAAGAVGASLLRGRRGGVEVVLKKSVIIFNLRVALGYRVRRAYGLYVADIIRKIFFKVAALASEWRGNYGLLD